MPRPLHDLSPLERDLAEEFARKVRERYRHRVLGMFYLARAVVFDLGLEAKTHSEIAALISLHLVRAGQFPAEQVRRYSQMQRVREDADYVTSIVMDEAAASEARHHLLEFREAVHHHLRGRGHQVP